MVTLTLQLKLVRTISLVLGMVLFLGCGTVLAKNGNSNSVKSLVPGNTGGMYYKLGGGDVTPLPYTPSTNDVNLDFSGNASLGFDCDSFDPNVSIVNALNGVGASFKNMASNVWNNMKGMLIAEAGYVMSRTMPNLYKYARDGISFGQFGYSLGNKSCEAMLADVDQGKNPANEWFQTAKKNDWQYHMSVAGTQAARDGLLGAEDSDVAQIKSKVAKDAGKNGVEWIHGSSRDNLNKAGGASQPIIYLVHDTVIAGYNVLLGPNRQYDSMSAPIKTQGNARLINAFANPKAAANWIIKVVGEQEITTYPGGAKKSIPGIGLLNDVQTQTETIKNKLTDLIEEPSQVTLVNLKAISPPKVLLNNNVIEMLRKQSSPLMRAIYVNKIAEEVAVAQIIDKAKLALQLIEVGRQVPPIYANSAAQKGIQADETRLKQWISDLRSNPKDNAEFVGNTIATLIQATGVQETASAAIRPSAAKTPVMEQGAISTS